VCALKVQTAEQSLALIQALLENQPGPARDIVQLNAGAALYACGLAGSLAEGVKKAGEVIAGGAARSKLDALVAVSNNLD